ncbi:acetaldehyde dehydrogenase (acetylating) [Saccharothrix sp.]|uniref:acetaldehyde dehydrogenase (acetylating) n=1 Tax=Saccharothrix sp. TaxID=1873460 RepID=UPI0028110B22|nr:acetaldehyde dehydrogenase (acetylating) [Saccharothrix sp.]
MGTGTPARVAVLGAGLIGLDLVDKIGRSPGLECVLVVGRDRESAGLRRAMAMGCEVTDGGIEALLHTGADVEVVFDASNADAHARHWQALEPTGATLIDLTPARLGEMIVPTVNGREALDRRHLSLVSCGGQAAVPVLHAVAGHTTLDYVEVVCTAASGTAGRATRLNIDDYLATTRDAVRRFSGAAEVKVMANLSPARPAPPFRVAVTVLTSAAPRDAISAAVADAARRVREFAPGYQVSSCAVTDERVSVAVQVDAAGDRLPRHAGNLDIITAAAVLLGEQHAAARAGGRR